jgi:Transposase DDE domain
MELDNSQQGLLPGYLASFEGLIGDKRTGVTFRETVKGIIGAGSLVCQRIAASSATLSEAKEGGQRVSRMARGESTKRSQIDAASVTAAMRERGIAHLGEAETDEVWLIADGSDLRKPYAREMPDLMRVRDLDGNLVFGYRTLNVVGITPSRRGVLYHRMFSSKEEDFLSESLEAQTMLQTVSAALAALKRRMTASWIMDSGFDDVAVWRTVWEQNEHVVCRVKHTERLVAYQDDAGKWVEGDVERARQRLKLLATAQTEMVVRRGRQTRAKRQRIRAKIKTCPIRLTYQTNVRRAGPGEAVQKDLWLVEVRLPDTQLKPWLLVTDWPVTDSDTAVRIFQMYRQRWAVEDSFRFVKNTLGWEEVQLLHMTGIRTLLALGWVAAGFLYELGITLDWEEVRLLARLGGWAERKGNKPGKTVLTRGLRRLLDMLVTQAFLDRHRSEHGDLPARIASLLASPSGEL